jgi:hypothetical protein
VVVYQNGLAFVDAIKMLAANLLTLIFWIKRLAASLLSANAWLPLNSAGFAPLPAKGRLGGSVLPLKH